MPVSSRHVGQMTVHSLVSRVTGKTKAENLSIIDDDDDGPPQRAAGIKV
jgi:hypothetical protein